MTPFVDAVTFTTPRDNVDAIRECIVPMCEMAGADYFGPAGVRFPGNGNVHISAKGTAATVYFSGVVLARMRAACVYVDLLVAVSQHPVNVGATHLTVDVVHDDEYESSRRVHAAYADARAGRIQPSRKAVPPPLVRSEFAAAEYNHAIETGTVYIGPRNRIRCRPVIYDKRQERLQHGHPDPGPTTRYELNLSRQVGLTLRDLAEPAAAFWHHCPRELLAPDVTPPDWRSHAEGAAFPVRPMLDPWPRLVRLLDGNDEMLRRMFALAHASGPHGLAMLLQRLTARYGDPGACGSEARSAVHPDPDASTADAA